jgi:hypothetical protein
MKTAVREEIIKDFAEARQSCLLAALFFFFCLAVVKKSVTSVTSFMDIKDLK